MTTTEEPEPTPMGWYFDQSGKREVLQRLGGHLQRWGSAVRRQYGRILPAPDPQELDHIGRDCDAFMLAVVLFDLLAVAKAIRDTLDSDARRGEATVAIDEFEAELPHLKNVRDVLQHLTLYERGRGNMQEDVRKAERAAGREPPKYYDWLNMWTEDRGDEFFIVIGHATDHAIGVPMLRACQEGLALYTAVSHALYQEIKDDLPERPQPI